MPLVTAQYGLGIYNQTKRTGVRGKGRIALRLSPHLVQLPMAKIYTRIRSEAFQGHFQGSISLTFLGLPSGPKSNNEGWKNEKKYHQGEGK